MQMSAQFGFIPVSPLKIDQGPPVQWQTVPDMIKLVEPSTSVVCLGILIDSKTQTRSIPPDKLQEIVQMCANWSAKRSCTKAQFQSLLGSLLYFTIGVLCRFQHCTGHITTGSRKGRGVGGDFWGDSYICPVTSVTIISSSKQHTIISGYCHWSLDSTCRFSCHETFKENIFFVGNTTYFDIP